MTTNEGTVLIVGALGVVGRAAAEVYGAASGWTTVGLSRRRPTDSMASRWVAADLRDASATREALVNAAPVTRIVYAALFEEPALVTGWSGRTQIDANVVMLRNLLDGLKAAGTEFEHLTLLQGTKAYGVHHGAYRMPAKESDPRFIASNFYYDQEDLVRERSAAEGWRFTVLRPQIVCGFALGNPMNAVTALGVYASICKELGQPMRFPGGAPCMQEAVDAGLLARAIKWAGDEPRAGGEIFNIANGDCFSWPNLWAGFAHQFGVEPGVAHSFSLATVMADKGEVWDRIVRKHGLIPHRYDEIVASWQFMDYLLRYRETQPRHSLVSTIKARQYGFHDCMDSEVMFASIFRELKAKRVLP